MELRCARCRLPIHAPVTSCPGCGAAIDPRVPDRGVDYYALFHLTPEMSSSEIRERLRDAVRRWSSRANTAPTMAQRHEADRMLQCVSEAEGVLLSPAARRSYEGRCSSRPDPGRSWPSAPPERGARGAPRSDVDPGPAAPPRNPATPVLAPRARADVTAPSGEDEGRGPTVERTWFGWTRLRGTVVTVDPVYTIPPRRSWLRVVLVLALIPLGVAIGVAMLAASVAIRLLSRRVGRTQTNVLDVFILLLNLRRAGAERPGLPVRDLRVVDGDGVEHGARIIGNLVCGTVNVGDDVTVSGFSSGGTLNVRYGVNHRTLSLLRVRT